jgi:ribonucleoside-diphosphate reductase alpha chain
VRAKKMAEESGSAGNGGGNGHANGHANGEAETTPAAAAMTDTPPVVPARIQGLDLGPACSQCGGMMQRTGSCYTCSSCGNNTGCG